MINRRLIRVKVLQTLYSYYQMDNVSIDKIEKELLYSVQKTYDLYYYLILLLIEINRFAKNRIEFNKNKLVPTREDLNPNTKFVDNKVIVQLQENRQFNKFLEIKKMSWAKHPDLIKNLYKEITENEEYIKYMEDSDRSYQKDKKFIIYVLENILNESEELYTTLEDQSIFWYDTIDFVVSMIIKTISRLKIGDDSSFQLLGKFKNKEDKEFCTQLLRKTILNQVEYKEFLNTNIKNWDYERLAYIDMIILQLSITELVTFLEIPIKVTINEFIEISKYYSTEKSSTFINGILDKLVKLLKSEGKIEKIGRGLIGEDELKTN